MNKHSIFTLLGMLILASCNTNENKKSDKKIVTFDTIQSIKSEKQLEKFDDFYKKFYSDSLFQFSRIVFPLKGEYSKYFIGDEKVPDMEDKLVIIKRNKLFWKKTGWRFLKTLQKQGDFGYNKKIEKKGKSMEETIYLDGSGTRHCPYPKSISQLELKPFD